MVSTGFRRHRRLKLPAFLVLIACHQFVNLQLPQTEAWNVCSNQPREHVFGSFPPQIRQHCPLRVDSISNKRSGRRISSLSSIPDGAGGGNQELPTSSSQTPKKNNRKNTDKNRRPKKNTRNKKGNSKRRRQNNKNKQNNQNNKNNNARRQKNNNNHNNNSSGGSNRKIQNKPTINKEVVNAPPAETVSELVQNVRRILNTKPGNDWRSAWSILRREATIPYHTVDVQDGQQLTVLPVRVYHDVLESMKREKRCWQDAIRLVNYMERGSDMPGTTVQSNNDEDDYNKRPWHIPSANYEIYHTLIECICNNGGGRRDAHGASVYWLSTMLRKLASELKQQQELEKSSSRNTEELATTTITNRDRKLIRNSIQMVLSSLSKQGRWRDALQLLDYAEILSRSDRANIPLTVVQYNTVLTCLARSKQVGQCQRLLQRLQERSKIPDETLIFPDEISYNAVIGACASSGKWREALTVLDECYQEPNFEPNIYIYTNAMRACAKGGNTEKALSLLQIVKDKGLAVDSYCYTAVIDACAKGKKWKKALELLDEMEEKGIQPTQVTYSVTISALGNGLQWERALWLLNLMRNKGMKVNLITYNAAITALAKSSKNKHSAKLSSSASSSLDGTQASGPSNSNSDDEELWPKALELLKQMDEDGIIPDGFCYSSAINCCGAEGRWEEACELIETMKRGGPKSRPNKVAYTAAISACGRAGQGQRALELFQNMKDDGLAADRVAYNALFSALRVSKDADRAYELWGEICGRQSSESSSIASARMVASPDIITLTDCIATLSRAGYTNKMDEVFREAVDRGIVLGRSIDDLDEQWEIDLSGLPFPIARAATRYLIQNMIDERSSKKSKGDIQDMIFITGIGKAQQRRKEELWHEVAVASSNNILDRKDRTTSLREFIQGILETDFQPSLESVVPQRAQGTVVIEESILAQWLSDGAAKIMVE